MNTTLWGAVIAGAFVVFGGIVTGIFSFMVGRRTAAAAELNSKKVSDTTMAVTIMDDRKDITHTFQTQLNAATEKLDSFRSELDKVRDLVLDYKEKLGLANVEIKDLRALTERQERQILQLQDSERARKQEYEVMISRLQDENKDQKDAMQVLRTENITLRGEVDTLRQQVQGNSRDIHDIGAIEVKAAAGKGLPDVSTSLQGISQERRGADAFSTLHQSAEPEGEK